MKTVENYVDYGFGFPVQIAKIAVTQSGDDEIPIIDYADLAQKVAKALMTKPARLTGNEVRFLRLHQEMTLAAFGKRFDVTHAAVKKWEAKGDRPTDMAWPTEKLLRLLICEKVDPAPDMLMSVFKCLEDKLPSEPSPIHVSMESHTGAEVDSSPHDTAPSEWRERQLPTKVVRKLEVSRSRDEEHDEDKYKKHSCALPSPQGFENGYCFANAA